MLIFAAALILTLHAKTSVLQQNVSKFPLAAFVGRDFKAVNYDDLEPMRAFLAAKGLGGENASRFAGRRAFRLDGIEPWALWDWNGNGSRFVLATARSGRLIPSQSWGGVYIFDSKGDVISSSVFGVGWRTNPTSIETQEIAGVGKVIHYSTRPVINGRVDVAGFFIGIDGSRPALIRIADKTGRLSPNVYGHPNYRLGPDFDTIGVIDELKSDSPVQILEALTWFAGKHGKPDPREWTENQEKFADSVRYKTLSGQPKTTALIVSLTHSPNPWIRDAAILALEHRSWP